MSGHIKSRQVELVVVTPEALILGKEEYHIEQGSIISLVCIIENSLLTPEYVFWYQDDRMINYDTNHGVQVQTTVGKKTSSRLNIKRSVDCRTQNTNEVKNRSNSFLQLGGLPSFVYNLFQKKNIIDEAMQLTTTKDPNLLVKEL